MFNFGFIDRIKKTIKKQMPKFSKVNINDYIPVRLKNEVKKIKPERKRSKGIVSIVAVGMGIMSVAAGMGIAKLIKAKRTKNAILIVGNDKNPKMPIGNNFSGYILKYTSVDSLDKTVDMLHSSGFEKLIVVPYTVINGYETEKIKNVMTYKMELFKQIRISPALLTTDGDYEYVAGILSDCTRNADEDTAVVFVAKGTTHFANSSYVALSERFKREGRNNIFVGTVSSYPGLDKIMSDIEAAYYRNVLLCPLEMEFNSDFIDDLNQWSNKFNDKGYTCGVYIRGLCGYKGIRRLIVEHTKAVM